MSARRESGATRAAMAAIVIIGLLAIMRPWTIRPIGTTHAGEFDPAGYVESVWTTRVLAEASRAAMPLAAAVARLTEPASGGSSARRSVFVSGTATVESVDTSSRVGLARLATPSGEDPVAVAIQIGPVVRGTALRDALDFIRFTDFANQLQFADVANALNDRVLRTVLAGIDPPSLTGRTVAFVGAVTLGHVPNGTMEIVPVKLDIQGGARGGA